MEMWQSGLSRTLGKRVSGSHPIAGSNPAVSASPHRAPQDNRGEQQRLIMADVAQLVVRLLVVQVVAGSNPVVRPRSPDDDTGLQSRQTCRCGAMDSASRYGREGWGFESLQRHKRWTGVQASSLPPPFPAESRGAPPPTFPVKNIGQISIGVPHGEHQIVDHARRYARGSKHADCKSVPLGVHRFESCPAHHRSGCLRTLVPT